MGVKDANVIGQLDHVRFLVTIDQDLGPSAYLPYMFMVLELSRVILGNMGLHSSGGYLRG